VTLDAPVAADVTAAALDDGLIVNAVAPDAVRFAPPLTLIDDELDEMLARFATAVDAVAHEAS
jgi:acetylornithine aminotransferase